MWRKIKANLRSITIWTIASCVAGPFVFMVGTVFVLTSSIEPLVIAALMVAVFLSPLVWCIYALWQPFLANRSWRHPAVLVPATFLAVSFALAFGLDFIRKDQEDTSIGWTLAEKVIFLTWLGLSTLAGIVAPRRILRRFRVSCPGGAIQSAHT